MSLGADGLCSVSPVRCAASSFTCAEPIGTQTPSRSILWIARHAKPLIAPGTCYGALDVEADPALTEIAAQSLVKTLPESITVLASPLKRCQQLAESLCSLRAGLNYQTDERLREMDFGIWEGVLWSNIPKHAVDAWTEDFASHRFGGKESANEVLLRVASVWDNMQADQPTLWIAHSGVAHVR